MNNIYPRALKELKGIEADISGTLFIRGGHMRVVSRQLGPDRWPRNQCFECIWPNFFPKHIYVRVWLDLVVLRAFGRKETFLKNCPIGFSYINHICTSSNRCTTLTSKPDNSSDFPFVLCIRIRRKEGPARF